jgi:diguanylate cyclase (GGDEF)-like protein
MPNPLVEFQLGRVGALSQLGSVTLITLFVGALYRSRRHRAYFASWFTAWLCVAGGLAAIVIRNSDLTWLGSAPLHDLPEDHPLVRTLYAAYSMGRLGFLVFLVWGALQFLGRRPPPTPRWALWLACLLSGTGITLLSGTLDGAILLRSVIAAPLFAACAILVVGGPGGQRSLGTSALATAFAAHAALRVLYAVGFVLERGRSRNPLDWLLSYDANIETLFQTLLAYGMVLVAMEETTRENQVAHAELEVAHHALRRAAYVDPLSGAGSRRAFIEGIGLETYVRGPATVALLDVDNLKAVNDALGHEAGDTMIRHMAASLRDALRPGDAIYRWGGDEFLIVFPGLGVSDATQLLDDCLERCASLSVSGIVLPVRASVGCVSLEDRTDIERAIQAADRAMYEAKVGRRAASAPPVFSTSGDSA